MMRIVSALRVPRTLFVATALFAVALVAGCTASSGGGSWKKGQSPDVSKVSEPGYYELVSGKQVVARYDLQPGDLLGFRTGSDGRVEAVGGTYTVPLSSMKAYSWRKAQ